MAGRDIRADGRATEIELFSVAGHDGHLREVNEAFARLLGLSTAEINDRSLLELVHPDDLTTIVAGLAALERGAAEALFECRFLKSDGHAVHLQWVARPLAGTDLWWAAGRDTTDFHRVLAEQLELRTRLDLVLGSATTAMWDLDIVSGHLSCESQAAQILGLGTDATPSSAALLAAAAHPEDAPAVLKAMDELAGIGEIEIGFRVGHEAELRHLSLRGRILERDRRGRPQRAVGLLLDVTTEKAVEEQMLLMVMSDPLTGIANRRAFDKTLRSEWRRCTRAREPLSILMIDIDNFKTFNDRFGNLVGNDALCAVSRALSAGVHREGDLVARTGGKEFAVVLPDTDSYGALTVGRRLVQAARAATPRQAAAWRMSVSVGTASGWPEGSAFKSVDLLDHADQALSAAKAAGKNRAVAYEEFLAAHAMVEVAIAKGLADGEFELYYQPLLRLSDNVPVGLEALMRWNRPGHGLVSPGDFIPIAETSTLICDLGRWALNESTAQLAAWSAQGLDHGNQLRVAVNVSGRHVGDASIVTDVQSALARAGLTPRQLELELTETVLVDGARAAVHLAAIRKLGVTVAIDDFGTGHTSIGQLPHLPADTLKIDRSFIASADPRQQALVALIIDAAHAFDLQVVGEGIETPETLHALRALGCDIVQGYLIGRPMPAADVPSWLSNWWRTTSGWPEQAARGEIVSLLNVDVA